MIVVFGTVCIDRLRQVPRLPAPGGYVEADSESVFLGGEAANTASHLTAWGDAVTLVTHPLGDDADGVTLRALVDDRGLKPIELARSGGEMSEAPVCDIYVTPDGERTIFGKGFTNSERSLTLEGMPFPAGDWFTVEPNMPTLARRAAIAAGEAGMRVWAMDFGLDDALPEGAVWQTSTHSSGDRDAAMDLAGRAAERHRGVGIVTDGPYGLAFAVHGERPRWVDAFTAPVVKDTTGAGDAFRAGCLHVLAAGGSWTEALSFGSASGALACGFVGASTLTPTAAEIRSLIGQRA